MIQQETRLGVCDNSEPGDTMYRVLGGTRRRYATSVTYCGDC